MLPLVAKFAWAPFVDRIRLGVTLFLAERGVERAEHDLPVWKVLEPGSRILLIAHAGTNSVTIWFPAWLNEARPIWRHWPAS